MHFKDQTTIVTGSGAGIGRATAMEFAKAGANVIVSDINIDQGKTVAEEIKANGGQAIFIKCDVSDEGDVQNLIDECMRTYDRIDHMVNNAGIGLGLKFFDQISNDQWNKVIAVNQTGVFYCMRAVLKVMKTQGKGAIVNVASAAGIGGAPRMGAYAATKHAVVGMTKTAAMEYGKYNIRINAVCPTVITTNMGDDYLSVNKDLQQIMLQSVPLRRFGKPEEVGQTIAWLCSDQASYLNGVALPIDGGSKA